MSRKRKAPKRIFLKDAKYKSNLILKLMNSIMYDGKKTIAEKIVYDALETLIEKLGQSPEQASDLFAEVLDKIKPIVEVKSRRVGGATYQIPVEIRQDRREALAMRWLIEAARSRSENNMKLKLANELLDASNNRGNAIKKKKKPTEWQKQIKHFLTTVGSRHLKR